jgi:putative hydrolases of HD superfamily
MGIKKYLPFLQSIEQLKNVDRAGYSRVGIKNPENVAEHTLSVVWYAILIAFEEKADIDKAIKIALLHDLPEVIIGDLPSPMVEKYLGTKKKQQMELSALNDLTHDLPAQLKDEWQTLFEEEQSGQTLEAKVVNNADRLQMYSQIRIYEKMCQADFSEFWQDADKFDWLPSAKTLLQELRDN